MRRFINYIHIESPEVVVTFFYGFLFFIFGFSEGFVEEPNGVDGPDEWEKSESS